MTGNKTIIFINGLKRSGKDTVADFIEDYCIDNNVPFMRTMLAHYLKEFIYKNLPYRLGLTWDDLDGKTNYDREIPIHFTLQEMHELLDKFIGDIILKQSNEMKYLIDRDIAKNRGMGILQNFMSEDGNGYDISLRNILQYFGTEIACYHGKHIWSEFTLHDIYNHLDTCDVMIVSDLRMENEVKYLSNYNIPVNIIKILREGLESNDTHITESGFSDELVNTLGISLYKIHNNGTLDDLKESLFILMEKIGA